MRSLSDAFWDDGGYERYPWQEHGRKPAKPENPDVAELLKYNEQARGRWAGLEDACRRLWDAEVEKYIKVSFERTQVPKEKL